MSLDSIGADITSDRMSELSLRPGKELLPNPNQLQDAHMPSSGQSDLHITGYSHAANLCPKHPSKQICNVCMMCKVGLCPKCFGSAALNEHKDHMHEVKDLEDAFAAFKTTCDALVQKALETRNWIQERSSKIQHYRRSLLTAHQTKNLAMFGLLDELKRLLDSSNTVTDMAQKSPAGGSSSVAEIMSDGTSNSISLDNALSALQSGTAELENFCTSEKTGSALYTKLAAISMLTDVLRIKLYHNISDGLEQNLNHLWKIITISKPCGRRLIMLEGVDLLLLCFETFKSNVDTVYYILLVVGNLSEFYASHQSMVTTRMVNMLTYVIQNFDMTQHQLPANACRILSYILSQNSLEWPKDCLSREEMSMLVMNTCKQFHVEVSLTEKYVSFRPVLSLLSQQESEAAKFWALWTLNRFTLLDPAKYCAMLVRDGGVAVLEKQDQAHDHVKQKSNLILQRIKDSA